ncbi:MAG: Fe-S cluster assembly scaffold protein NifU [Bacillota bacterium]|nr:Fe-S cluster assembly scaffold protein NifU [Bacillota bacterium]MDI7250566.1 Fe-S cluster assembly scaffold protein NifU [Bacillota bacterium]
MYSQKVMEHFTNPRNVGEIPDPDGVGTVGNPVCGDLMKITIRVKDNRIEDIKFLTFGCGAAIATSSMVTELVKGKTLEEAMRVTNRAVAEALDGLPPIKMHCSNLAADALHEAIKDYLSRNDGRKAAGETYEGAPGDREVDERGGGSR